VLEANKGWRGVIRKRGAGGGSAGMRGRSGKANNELECREKRGEAKGAAAVLREPGRNE